MSADIKPGQIWAWRGGCGSRSAPGVTFEIVEASASAPDVTYRYQPREGFDSERIFAAPAEDIHNAAALLVETVDASEMSHHEIEAVAGKANADFLTATPAPSLPTRASDDDGRETAPLDPGAVKAGDTVEVVVTPVGHAPEYIVKGGVWASSAGELFVGREELASVRVSLLAHTPAPEPEPEWEPGTVAEATVRGVPRVRILRMDKPDRHPQWLSVTHRDALGATLHHARQVTDVRPLVVIDPAGVDVVEVAKAMHQVDYPGLDFALNLDQSVYVAKARAALAHLGIEVPR